MKIYAYFNRTTNDVRIIKEFVFNRKIIDSTFTLIDGDGSFTRKMSLNAIRSLVDGLYIGDEHVSVLMALYGVIPHKENNEKFLILLDSPKKIGIMCKNTVVRVVLDYNGFRILDINDPENQEFNFDTIRYALM